MYCLSRSKDAGESLCNVQFHLNMSLSQCVSNRSSLQAFNFVMIDPRVINQALTIFRSTQLSTDVLKTIERT